LTSSPGSECRRMRNKKTIVIPHEHGGWAMVIVPYLAGLSAGTPNVIHIPLFLGWLLFYMAAYPLLQCFKRNADRARLIRWSAGYAAAALVCMIVPLSAFPELLLFGLPLAVLLPVNIWYASRKAERALVNDLCALLIFSIGGAAAYLTGGGGWDRTMAVVVLISCLFFIGSVFFVKSVFRERTNADWLRASYVYHGLLLAAPVIAGKPVYAL